MPRLVLLISVTFLALSCALAILYQPSPARLVADSGLSIGLAPEEASQPRGNSALLAAHSELPDVRPTYPTPRSILERASISPPDDSPSTASAETPEAACPPESGTPEIAASAWALYDASSGRFLGGENEHERRFPASLTKIGTAIVALREDSLDRSVTVTEEWWRPGSQGIGLPLNTVVNTRDLFVAMLTISANDAASELASETAGSVRRFARLMNELAGELGLRDTHFINPHGLDEAGHYSSAHDLALLSAEALSFPEFREVVGSREAEITIGPTPWDLDNTNGLLYWYPDATGLKTGTTSGAGPSLAASAQRDAHELIAVVLNSPDRNGEAAALLDWGFALVAAGC